MSNTWKYQIIDGHGLHFTDEIEYDSLERVKTATLDKWSNIYYPESAIVFSKIDKNHIDIWAFNIEGHRGEWYHRGILVKSTYQMWWVFWICSIITGVANGFCTWNKTHNLGYSLFITILCAAAMAVPCFIFSRLKGHKNES